MEGIMLHYVDTLKDYPAEPGEHLILEAFKYKQDRPHVHGGPWAI